MKTLEQYYREGASFLLKILSGSGEVKKNDEGKPVLTISIEDLDYALKNDVQIPEVSFPLEPFKAKSNVLAAKGIHSDGHLVTFDTMDETVRADLWVLVENRIPIIYPKVRIDTGKDYNNEIPYYIIIRPIIPPTPINKRNTFRVFSGLPCQIHFGEHKGVVNGMLKDVSTEGFSVEVRADLISNAIPQFDEITAEFSDNSISSNIIKVTGKCVRKVESEKGTILYGCHAKQTSAPFKTYVMTKQARKAGRKIVKKDANES